VDQVPFEQVERIKQALSDEGVLPGLIAAFSKATSDDLLLVYPGRPPAARPPGSMAITLADLAAANLLEYDGPIMGLAAIDLVRWDIPTKGPEFCRLDRFLRRQGQARLLRESWVELASYLRQKLDEITSTRPDEARGQRALAEIAAISAPQKIASLPMARRRGMVAFIPERNEAVCLDETSLDAMSGLDLHPEEKVIALEEVRPLIEASYPPHLQNHYPIELRTILRRSQLDADLGGTLGALALAFHRRWGRTGTPEDRERAYALALELQLAKGDVDDLSAVLPDEDFETFLRDGTGTYVYRRPLERGGGPSAKGVRRLSLDDARDELSQGASPATFSLLPLRDLLCSAASAEQRWSDLGPVFRNIGRTEILARNAWLLVQDFLDTTRDRRNEFRVSPESLLETMTHCCAIFSLTDPWRARQGRRNEWLLEAYETLQRVLRILVQTSDGTRRSYYTALDHWYGCALKDGPAVVEALKTMVATLDARANEMSHHDEPGQAIAERVESLENLGNALLDLLRGGGRAEAYVEAYEDLLRPTPDSIPQVVRRATNMARPMEVPSEPFRASFQQYATIGDTVRWTRASQIPVRDKIERLKDCTNRLLQARRLIFAHHHEAHILSCLYDHVISETEGLVQRLQGGASLEVELKTRSIAPHREDSGIVFSVTNVGTVEARDVEVELLVSEAFELLDQSFKQTLPRLGPEDQHRFRFSVRSLTGDEAFPVRCTVSCSDSGQERQQRTLEFSMRVAGLDAGPFHQKPNPYVFGLPLQEHRQFYGRRSELEKLLSHLAIRRPQNILLRGARRTGKTSLLYMVRAVLTDTGGRSGARSWFDLPQTWYEALDSTAPVILDLQAIEWRNDTPTATGFYQAVLAALRDADLRSDGSDWLLDEPSVTGTQFVQALRAILRDAGDVRPVMLVDEFDILDQIAEASSFYGPLRHVISTVQGVTWVVASALGLYKEVRDYESPLFNVFKIIDLGLLEPDAARRLIRSPWQQDQDGRDVSGRSRLRFADDAVEAILEESGCYPYFIQLLCSEIVEHVNATRTSYVEHKTVFQVIEQQMVTESSAASEHFAYLWDRAGGMGKLILLTLLRHPGVMAKDELEEAVQRYLRGNGLAGRASSLLPDYDDSLQRLLVVEAVQRAPGGGYRFGIPLFRRLLLKRNEREDLEEAAYQALAMEQAQEARRG